MLKHCDDGSFSGNPSWGNSEEFAILSTHISLMILFFVINGVKVHHKICHHKANKEDKEEAIRGKIGLPMILLHGFGALVFSWGRIMKPMAWLIGSKVLAFDRPAFGLISRTRSLELVMTSH
ncbi:hypothetical protein IEQ34_019232 [Dendrobium chrysotoxum]|uniref:Uncharacterized protein n=1 Tax=Dendrobium chrysotoxum TaxID=161865 RepID=A0AAV7G836_DENCH|nr:hypothetical protein IEQ34_019232 [Dendrobium chrysotoxum]